MSTFQHRVDRYQEFVRAGHDIETEKFYSKKHTSPVYGTQDYLLPLKKRLPKQCQEIPQSKQLHNLPHPKQILKIMQEHYGIKQRQLINSQPRQRNEPRDIAIYLCRKRSQLSHPEIAKLFQLNHYTSAASAVQRVEKDAVLMKQAANISNMLT